MTAEDRDTTIEDIHRLREEIVAQHGGDLIAITADARKRMEQSGCVVRHRRNPPKSGKGGHC